MEFPKFLKTFVGIFVFGIMLLCPLTGQASRIGPKGCPDVNVQERLKSTPLVFTGVVLEKDRTYGTTFAVTRFFKVPSYFQSPWTQQKPEAKIIINSIGEHTDPTFLAKFLTWSVTRSSSAPGFKLGENYLIFAYDYEAVGSTFYAEVFNCNYEQIEASWLKQMSAQNWINQLNASGSREPFFLGRLEKLAADENAGIKSVRLEFSVSKDLSANKEHHTFSEGSLLSIQVQDCEKNLKIGQNYLVKISRILNSPASDKSDPSSLHAVGLEASCADIASLNSVETLKILSERSPGLGGIEK